MSISLLYQSTYLHDPCFCTYSKLPGAKPPLKDSEVIDEQAAAERVLHIQTDQPAAKQPPHLQHEGEHSYTHKVQVKIQVRFFISTVIIIKWSLFSSHSLQSKKVVDYGRIITSVFNLRTVKCI